MARRTANGEAGTSVNRRAAAQRGYTYLLLLFFLAASSIGLAVAGEWWYRDAMRENERELLFVGEQFAAAIGSYYESSPSAARQFPRALEELLHDRRHAAVRRHLRRIYVDPMTRTREWGIVKNAEGAIVGVYSLSGGRPLRRQGFPPGREGFAAAADYTRWQFVYYPGASAPGN